MGIMPLSKMMKRMTCAGEIVTKFVIVVRFVAGFGSTGVAYHANAYSRCTGEPKQR